MPVAERVSTQLTSVTKQGFLFKRASNSVNNFKNHWFYLKDDYLLYIKVWSNVHPNQLELMTNLQYSKPGGLINLDGATIKELGEGSPNKDSLGKSGNPSKYCFKILMRNGKEQVVGAKNTLEMEEWKKAIEEAVKEANIKGT